MRFFLTVCLLLLPLAVLALRTDANPSNNAVLVELYTSQGCSSCPPAEEVLDALTRQQPSKDIQIIALAFHVDYWDRLGWKDLYGSPVFSRRQRMYAQAFKSDRIYTPQMIVDGMTEFVGSNKQRALAAIDRARESAKANIRIALLEKDTASEAPRVQIDIEGVQRDDEHEVLHVMYAITENGLHDRIPKGENVGRELHQMAVVRYIEAAGVVEAEQHTFSTTLPLKLEPTWKPTNLNIVVFLQSPDLGPVRGAAMLKL